MSEREDKDMLDPEWTPEAGYSHAARLLEILTRSEINGDALEANYKEE
jgi:hypothetical protein